MARHKKIEINLSDLKEGDQSQIITLLSSQLKRHNAELSTVKIIVYKKYTNNFPEAANAYSKLQGHLNAVSYTYSDQSLITATQLAQILGITRITLQRWDRSGLFKFRKQQYHRGTRWHYTLGDVSRKMKKYLKKA